MAVPYSLYMEGSSNEQFDAIILDMEDGPERVLAEALQSFDTTHTQYLESAVMLARDRSNPLTHELMKAIGQRLIDEFQGCLNVIGEVETLPAKRIESVAWFLTYEQNKRADFMNFYAMQTRIAIEKIGEDDSLDVIERLATRSDPQRLIYQAWRKSFTATVAEFVQNYKG